ncbi:hypothetical protein MAR_016638 [Mya arenaria]|uniref:Uncharacterized protein n=1 Tax=Mya arenaria TaxID=6604 RepID=A0ABY7FMW9_MYAAR|nr:hypothetical protein MAR_016638 [Mya arenaria]
MRDNLVFTNIVKVMKTCSTDELYEDTETVLTEFLSSKLNLYSFQFERVHRMPSNRNPQRNAPRPIVAKISFFNEREEVHPSWYMLNGTTFGISEQFPEEIEMKRILHSRGQKKHTILVRDRLFVDGRQVRARGSRYIAGPKGKPRTADRKRHLWPWRRTPTLTWEPYTDPNWTSLQSRTRMADRRRI